MKSPDFDSSSSWTRRTFLKQTSTAAGITLLGSLGIEQAAFAAADNTIKIALIGCGGRGSGAVNQALNSGKDVKLVALADIETRIQMNGRNCLV